MVFSGTVSSDFEKLVVVPDVKKSEFINFAATDFITFRSSLIDYIKAVYPLDYHNFSESDLGIMFAEIGSYIGAVTSMKTDMLANENFLRTVKNRNNLRKLLQLIGVQMRGPTSAAANARLQVLGSPASFAGVDMTNQITIDPGYRTISVKSPEDAGPLNYTLYKVVNGDVAIANAGGQIKLTNTETDNPAAATDPSSVFTNLVLLEGAYVTTSGSFVSTESVKTISLPESPVVEGSVDVFITSPDSGVSGAYTKVDNVFFASGATDNIFQVVYDDDFRATVVFGDGVMGTSPGLDSTYLVTYRVGGGTRGNIPSDYINTTITITDGGSTKTGSLTNVSLAAGGSDAETVEHAKKYAPYFFKRQDRLVTLQDYSTSVSYTHLTLPTNREV